MVRHIIKLEGEVARGASISLQALSKLSYILTEASQRILRLRIESRSNLQSRPAWLDAATDIRLVGLDRGSTVLVCEAPTLGEAAPTIFEQQTLWETRPHQDLTVLSLVEETFRDAIVGNTESDLLDRNTLNAVVAFRDLLNIGYESFSLGQSDATIPAVRLNSDLLSRVEILRDEAPSSQRVVITGTLDELTGSKRAFRLLLANGQSLRGMLPLKDPRSYKDMFREKVVVDGEAHYRLSGKISLIVASNIQIATEKDRAFEFLPRPRPRSLGEIQPRLVSHTGTSGMSQVFGRWVTEESEEELLAALKEMK